MRNPTRTGVVDAFVGALVEAGHKASRTPNGHLMVDGVDLDYRFRATEKQARFGLIGSPTGVGHASITVGSYRDGTGKTHQFPERKQAPRYDFARAIPLLLQVRDEVAAQQAENAVQCANRPVAEALREELGIDPLRMRPPFHVGASTSGAQPIRVRIDVGLDMTVEEARRLFQALGLHGVPVRPE